MRGPSWPANAGVLALWGFTWLAVDMQIAPSKADDMRSTAKSLPTQVATIEIRYGEDDPGISREKPFLWCPSSAFQELS
ncbi:hypothetical protein ES319_A03G133800v1 [Gossypium barbadense]|uniref:Uncharacterized protein n=2 Tax=Gossypium TaxID=3633 RepID=A0A5J5WCZ0_GOSBA|nr:hypothetical protein ES319_A03G133800v1 [Gossypium barbadense]